MEHLPVEVIGNILSLIGSARDVVIASATCKKWREALHNHVHNLSFDYCDWPLYNGYTSSGLEILITQTIFQTKALQFLTIFLDDMLQFSAAPVIAWLMYTRNSLRRLRYNVRTIPSFNIIEKCNWQKLEVLSLSHSSITGVELSYLKFPCLNSLRLCHVTISPLDLSPLLSACPKLETLAIVSPDIPLSDSQVSLELSSRSLKDFLVESFCVNRFILEADLLESLHLKECIFEVFELIGKGTLEVLKIDGVSVIHLDIGDSTENLQIIDVCNFTILWQDFFHMISKASKLYRLRLWDVAFDNEEDVVDIKNISACFPLLTHLSLSYDLTDGVLDHGFQGSFCLMNVVVLELGWTDMSDLFSAWVAELLEGCPNLRKLVICAFVSPAKTHEECRILARFSESILRLGRKYGHVKFKFEYV